MARTPRPWFRAERNAWYVMLHAKQRFLGEQPSDAPKPRQRDGKWNVPKPIMDEFYRLMSAEEPEPDAVADAGQLAVLLDRFLEWTQKNKPDSYSWYLQRIGEFHRRFPSLSVAELKPLHVQEWIDTKKSDGHKRGCLIAVNRALNWAVRQGHIDKNPIRMMEKPPAGRRDIIVSDEMFRSMLDLSSDDAFRDLLTFCWETGCRPQEVFRLEARHLDLPQDRCIFPEKESKGKRKKRVIYFTDTSKEIILRLMQQYPDGRLFRNSEGEPWHRNNVACRFARLQHRLSPVQLDRAEVEAFAKELKKRQPMKKVAGVEVAKRDADLKREARAKLKIKHRKGVKFCLYNLRHTWMTRMLKAGVDPITVATMAGHNDPAMLARIYAHIQNDTTHLKAALAKLK